MIALPMLIGGQDSDGAYGVAVVDQDPGGINDRLSEITICVQLPLLFEEETTAVGGCERNRTGREDSRNLSAIGVLDNEKMSLIPKQPRYDIVPCRDR